MEGQRIGYVRVSTLDQNTERQLNGLEFHKTFTDKASGKDAQRPQLQEVLEYVRDGDTLVVHSMDRLARNLNDLREIVSTLTAKGVQVQFVKENLLFKGDEDAMQTLMLSIMGAFAEFERNLIRERQREGIQLAKQRGVYKGRKAKLTNEQATEVRQRVAAGEKKTILAREFGISRETLYSYLRAA
ncbi:MAG: recombinase family protein [Alphaproteobacteria bacterium]|nr:recombinase family protein [Alphaproteobacteria bacterium]MDD9920429.1 recombinase family protein [Alphaproteobacteria bacterium]